MSMLGQRGLGWRLNPGVVGGCCRDILARYDVTKDPRSLDDLEPLLKRRVSLLGCLWGYHTMAPSLRLPDASVLCMWPGMLAHVT